MIRRLSSRATIAAGTKPPRVMHTTAWNGPASASRQASARASRWNASQETGKAFSGSGGGEPRRIARAHDDIGVGAALVVEERIAADHGFGMCLGDVGERPADVALARVGPQRLGQHLGAGLERRRHEIEHRLHDGGHTRRYENDGESKTRGSWDLVAD